MENKIIIAFFEKRMNLKVTYIQEEQTQPFPPHPTPRRHHPLILSFYFPRKSCVQRDQRDLGLYMIQPQVSHFLRCRLGKNRCLVLFIRKKVKTCLLNKNWGHIYILLILKAGRGVRSGRRIAEISFSAQQILIPGQSASLGGGRTCWDIYQNNSRR